MDEKLKQLWIKALRSGKYYQGKRLLCLVIDQYYRSYCPLGVLAEVLGLERRESSRFGPVSVYVHDGIEYWASLPVSIVSGEIQDRIILMNDQDDLTFSQVADEIEKGIA